MYVTAWQMMVTYWSNNRNNDIINVAGRDAVHVHSHEIIDTNP